MIRSFFPHLDESLSVNLEPKVVEEKVEEVCGVNVIVNVTDWWLFLRECAPLIKASTYPSPCLCVESSVNIL